VLGERRLAFKRMQAKSESAAVENTSADGEARPELPEAEEITIASLSAQTRRLLRALTIVVTASVLLWVWSDVTPALSYLGDTNAWTLTQAVDGKELSVKVSWRDLIEAFVMIVLTWVATRNLPGLLEVGILRRFHVDAATRYAATSVTRYLIVFTGVIIGLSMLGLRWANLQWLAAGFSVGLGFGMQEIFANFISGLIVLFERPFRIGDIVTIGNVEGTVARIRTRATTIVDWDNKEVVVPNKNFITDRLVNWTLSDSTTRIVIKVGIAYRNDPREAQKILLDVANSHQQVLRDPAPACPMTGFGDSTQNFELRIYVSEISQRGSVQSELQFRIVDLCREHDIELAFPQRDIWIRNPEALRPTPDATDEVEAKPKEKKPRSGSERSGD
jgi:potassium efflux system protein